MIKRLEGLVTSWSDIRMVLEEPVEDKQGVTQHEKEVDDLIGQGRAYEKLSQENQGSRVHLRGGLGRRIDLNVLSYKGALSK
jgi:hypothetical protein